jgi:hypothetical protein
VSLLRYGMQLLRSLRPDMNIVADCSPRVSYMYAAGPVLVLHKACARSSRHECAATFSPQLQRIYDIVTH